MSITKPLIFTGIAIADADGTNVTNYSLHDVESATVELTPSDTTVDDGQTLRNFYDVAASASVFNATLLTDGRVYSNTAATPSVARLCFSGGAGSSSLNIENVIINGNKDFTGDRTAIAITASKRGTTIDGVVNES